MWVTHLPTKDEGAYIETVDGKLNVWSITHKKVVEWDPKDTEIVLDNSIDDFSLMLKVMVSEQGKSAFKPKHILVTCLDTIKWYLAHENLHLKTIDERIQTMQEVLYFAAGKEFELGGERDKLIIFIHNSLPFLMMGSLVGFKLAKDYFTSNKPLFDPTQFPSKAQAQEKKDPEPEEYQVQEKKDPEPEYSDSEEFEDAQELNVELKVHAPSPRKRFCWC
jgi:hypothetical protein